MSQDFSLTVICPDCGSLMLLYQRPGKQPFYQCTRCFCSLGAHADGRPSGTPADAATREARRLAHEAFDPLWQNRVMSRNSAYRLLAGLLGKQLDDAHIGMLTAGECYQLIELLKDVDSRPADLRVCRPQNRHRRRRLVQLQEEDAA